MTTVKEGIDGLTLANQIRLERATHKGSFLLVEGDSDCNVFRRFCDSSACSIVVCLGTGNLHSAINELDSSCFQGALGFADRDFAHFLGYIECKGTVVYTDENDIEVMVLCSGSLERVLEEIGNDSIISKTEEVQKKSVREIIFQSASVIGCLRLVSQVESLSLQFDGMSYKFRANNSCVLDKEKTIRHVLGRSGPIDGLSENAVIDMIGVWRSKAISAKELCRGHDCVRVLGRALKKQFGNKSDFNNDAGARVLESILRLAYDFVDFRGTKAYGDIRRWEKDSGFRVLIDE